MRECAAAFIVKNKKVLLGKRSTTREFYPDVWDVFGGHLNPGETTEEALRRELYEELGIVPARWEFLLTVQEPNEDKYGQIKYHIFLVTAFDGEPQNLQPEEHSFIRWFEFEQAVDLPFPHPLYAELIEDFSKPDTRKNGLA